MHLSLLICAIALQGPQGAAMGGGFGGSGGLAGGMDGSMAPPNMDAIRRDIDLLFFNSTTGTGLLTPGEYVEWTIQAKQGQVVAAQAESAVFDAALQIVGPDGAVLAENDDRYPGDQRPLVLARAKSDGVHMVRARSFRDRSGGAVSGRLAALDCADAEVGSALAVRPSTLQYQLVRVGLKAGQAVRFQHRAGPIGTSRAIAFYHGSGVPLTIQREIRDLEPGLMVAPIDGEYLTLFPGSAGGTVVVDQVPVVETGQPFESRTVISKVPVKAGQLIRAGVGGPASGRVAFLESPFSQKHDLKSANLHPFLPKSEDAAAFRTAVSREGDRRHQVLFAKRDTELWMVAVPGEDRSSGRYATYVHNAWTDLPEGDRGHSGRLPVGDVLYLRFPAKLGEVYRYELHAEDFRPELAAVAENGVMTGWQQQGQLDQSVHTWIDDVREEGYVGLRLSGVGNGGGGAYKIARHRVPSRAIEQGKALEGTIRANEAQLVEFKVPAKTPLVVKWSSDRWGYQVRYLAGRALQVREADPNTYYAFVLEQEARVVRFILVGSETSKYRIEIRPADRPPQ